MKHIRNVSVVKAEEDFKGGPSLRGIICTLFPSKSKCSAEIIL